MKKIIKSVALIVLGVFFLTFCSIGLHKCYECIVLHYPDEFVEVYLYEDPEDHNPSPSVFDKGKAIYDRRYVYNNKLYRTEIARDEFEESFFVCKYKPSRAFSESDLETPTEDLAASILSIVVGIILIAIGIVSMVREIRGGKKYEYK